MNDYNYPKSGLTEEIRRFFREGSALSNLILINLGIWLFIQVVRVIFFLINRADDDLITTVIHYFALPARLPTLIREPWTLLSYMFLHVDIWHILFNMLWLFWFGKIFLQYLTPRKLVWVYVAGGLTGGFVYILSFNAFPVFSESLHISRALGASASVMAIVSAISFYIPDYTINLFLLGRIRIVYLAIILFVFDFFMIPSGNSGGHIAHIGGALFGFLYAQFIPRAGRNSSFGWKMPDFVSGFKSSPRKADPQVRRERPASDEEYNRQRNENQKKIDSILEKISGGGYESLTREEKEFLFKSSNKR